MNRRMRIRIWRGVFDQPGTPLEPLEFTAVAAVEVVDDEDWTGARFSIAPNAVGMELEVAANVPVTVVPDPEPEFDKRDEESPAGPVS